MAGRLIWPLAVIAAVVLFPAVVAGLIVLESPPLPPPLPPPSPALPPLKPPEVAADMLELTSGDRVSGKVEAITPDGMVRISSQAFAKPGEVRLDGVRKIMLGGGLPHAEEQADSVVLTNGNRISGDIQEISQESITIKTKSMGAVEVKRNMVKRIDFGTAETVIFETDFSKGKTEPWRVTRGPWKFVDAAYLCTAGIGEAHTPLEQRGPLVFEWTVNGQQETCGATMVFFAKNASAPYGDDSIWIDTNDDAMLVYRCIHNQIHLIKSNSFSPARGRAVFRAAYDPSTGYLGLYVDGSMVGGCRVEPRIEAGSYIFLITSSTCAYEKVRVLCRGPAGAGGGQPEANTDKFILTNEDELKGTLKALKDGTAIIESPYGNLEIPKGKVQTVLFRSAGQQDVASEKTDAKVVFCDGQVLTVRLEKMDAESIEAKSAYFGEVKIRRDAVREIHFNR